METEPTAWQQPKRSNKKLFIVIGAVVGVLIVVAVAVAVALGGGTKQETAQNATDQATQEAAVATNEEVQQNLKDLDATIKAAATDQATAKASIEDGKKQTKVAE